MVGYLFTTPVSMLAHLIRIKNRFTLVYNVIGQTLPGISHTKVNHLEYK